MPHEIVLVQHDPRRRRLRVQWVEPVTPGMLSASLGGPDPDLAGFANLSPDDHVKLYLPDRDGARRDYTQRRHDTVAGELAIDFALHESGPATRWAREARPGDVIEVGGPRSSRIVPADFDWWLLVGDDTALPAIGHRLEEFSRGVPLTTVVAVDGFGEKQHLETAAAHRAV